jgi:hypothetical protein
LPRDDEVVLRGFDENQTLCYSSDRTFSLHTHERGREMAKIRRKDTAEHIGLHTQTGEVFLVHYNELWYLFCFESKHGNTIKFPSDKLPEVRDAEKIISQKISFSDSDALTEEDLSTITALIEKTDFMKARKERLEKYRLRNNPTDEERAQAKAIVMAKIHEKLYQENAFADAFVIASAYKIDPEEIKSMIRDTLTNGVRF